MGSRGASSVSAGNYAKMPMAVLQKKLAEYYKQAELNMGWVNTPWGSEAEWKEARDNISKINEEIKKRELKEIKDYKKKHNDTTTKRKFVNSDGEATSRYITTGTYERAMKRSNRDVAAFVGRR